MIRVGTRVLVETQAGDVPARVTAFRSGYTGENFRRVDVVTDDGRRWNGCHPKHVRRAA